MNQVKQEGVTLFGDSQAQHARSGQPISASILSDPTFVRSRLAVRTRLGYLCSRSIPHNLPRNGITGVRIGFGYSRIQQRSKPRIDLRG
jgi:hypothetical protein